MIQINQLCKAYGPQTIFEDVSFTLNKGEKCALVGRNGSGKTTLLNLICGSEQPDAGEIRIPKGYRIGILKQHLNFTESTLVDEAAKGLPNDRRDQTYIVEAILFGLGFNKNDLNKNPTIFSGGYQIRIHLCKLLASEPNCLLLDEPSNYLDIISLRWLVRFLKGWKGEAILISHDREFLDNISTHTLGIHRHQLKKNVGGTEDYYSQLLIEEEIYERTRQNLDKKKAHMQAFVDRFGAKATKAAQAQSRIKAIEKLPALEKLAQLHHLDFTFRYAPYHSRKVLSLTNASFTYPDNDINIIENFNLFIDNREKIAIIGKNGRGKSTLLQILASNLKIQSGNLKLADNVKIGYFGQTHIDRLNPFHTIYEEISTANPTLPYTEVKSICGTMMFPGDLSDKKIGVLSGGERSRVLLGKILATPCNFLLLDEPTNHLDMESVEVLIDAIESFEGAVVLVSHSEWILRRIPSRLVICQEDSKMLYEGTYEDFLDKIGWEEEKREDENKKRSDRKIERKKKAEHVQYRSKLLAPIKKKLESIEKKITEVQICLEENSKKLILTFQSNEIKKASMLSKEIDGSKKLLDDLFNEYEALLNQYESFS